MSSASVEPTVVARSAGTSEPAGTSAGSAFDDAAAAAFADEAAEAYDEKVPIWVKIALPAGLVGIVLVSFALGKYSVSPAELVDGIVRHFQGQTLAGDDLSLDKVIFNIRIPRILLVVMVGAALSAAGASFQGMFRNPLVSPDLLGASAGAGLGACIGLLLGWSTILTQLMAFATGLLAVGIAVFMNRMVTAASWCRRCSRRARPL